MASALAARGAGRGGPKIEDLAMAVAASFILGGRCFSRPIRSYARKLERPTDRVCHLMPRGVDAELFHPANASANPRNRDRVLGFVGRLSVEKNVALLAMVQEELERLGQRSFSF